MARFSESVSLGLCAVDLGGSGGCFRFRKSGGGVGNDRNPLRVRKGSFSKRPPSVSLAGRSARACSGGNLKGGGAKDGARGGSIQLQVHFSEDCWVAAQMLRGLQNDGGQIWPWRPWGLTNRIGIWAEDGQVAVQRMVAQRTWPWRPWGLTNQIGLWAEDGQVAVRRMVAKRMVRMAAQIQLQVRFLEDRWAALVLVVLLLQDFGWQMSFSFSVGSVVQWSLSVGLARSWVSSFAG